MEIRSAKQELYENRSLNKYISNLFREIHSSNLNPSDDKNRINMKMTNFSE